MSAAGADEALSGAIEDPDGGLVGSHDGGSRRAGSSGSFWTLLRLWLPFGGAPAFAGGFEEDLGAGLGVREGVVMVQGNVETGTDIRQAVPTATPHLASHFHGTNERNFRYRKVMPVQARLENPLIEGGVVGGQEVQAFQQGRDLLPHRAERRGILDLIPDDSVNSGEPEPAPGRPDQAMDGVGDAPVTNDGHTDRTGAVRKGVGRLEIYGGKGWAGRFGSRRRRRCNRRLHEVNSGVPAGLAAGTRQPVLVVRFSVVLSSMIRIFPVSPFPSWGTLEQVESVAGGVNRRAG